VKIPILIQEKAGIERCNEPLTVAVPFPKGGLFNPATLALLDEDTSLLPLQTQVMDRWSDRSCRWVLLDFQATVRGMEKKYYVLNSLGEAPRAHSENAIILNDLADALEVITGPAAFRLPREGSFPFTEVVVNRDRILDCHSSELALLDADGRICEGKISKVGIDTNGSVRTTIYMEGYFSHRRKRKPLAVFLCRLNFFVGRASVKMEFTVRNPRAAKHAGGLWDLGDPGSIFFQDLSLHLKLEEDKGTIYWAEESRATMKRAEGRALEIYQDSSGGKNWQSGNHVNRFGKVMNAFQGYRVRSDDDVILQGNRAQPTVMLVTTKHRLAASIQSFWENFPKALEARENQLVVRLFPGQYADHFELQGGEQKTHTVYLDFAGCSETRNPLAWTREPLTPRLEPEWHTKTEAFPYLLPEAHDANKDYLDLIHCAIEGDNNFFHRREIIDEYGWRHFGDLYADHENAYYRGPKPVISHYNNQYDAIYAFALHYARSGDARWYELMQDLARHVIDIDIYHTFEDKPAYSGGLFWHSDHYTDAATATHRTFSKRTMEERSLKDYGGGPSNEHLYTTGLMTYYFLTGDSQAHEAVLGLADWVIRMDDGKLTTLRFFNRSPTGLASQTASRDYHGPGRGAANSVNALLDAYRLSRNCEYLEKAEELIRRCIHPDDRIERLNLLDAERRWSYLVFLQVLGKYLDSKIEQDQLDGTFNYARESLLSYARWMMEHEIPYSRIMDQVEYPTETWVAHDLRKSNIFEWAARYSGGQDRELFLEKASFFYENSLYDLKAYPSKTCTRPLVLLLYYGCMHSYFQLWHKAAKAELYDSPPRFTSPQVFKTQRHLVESRLRFLRSAAGAVIVSLLALLGLRSK
jgi:hypothetical protein